MGISNNKLNRRDFLKGSGAAAAAVVLSDLFEGKAYAKDSNILAEIKREPKAEDLRRGFCKNVCHLACARFTTVKDGRVVNIEGDKDGLINEGRICAKGKSVVKDLYAPNRILFPLKRERDQKGFRRIGWDQAIAEISAKLREIRSEWDGKPTHQITPQQYRRVVWYESPNGDGGVAVDLLHRFGRTFPAALHYSGCAGCFGNWWRAGLATVGSITRQDPAMDIVNSKFILNIGYNLAETATNYLIWINRAREKGVKVVYLDVRRTPTADQADEFIPIRPGADGAFILGLLNVLLIENKWGYKDIYKTVEKAEWDKFLNEEVKKYPPEEAEKLTWIPAETIRRLAKEIHAAGRQFAQIDGTHGCTASNGFVTGRLYCMLNIALGAYAVPGGGEYSPKPTEIATIKLPVAGDLLHPKAVRFQWPMPKWAGDIYDWHLGFTTENHYPEVAADDIRAIMVMAGNPLVKAADSTSHRKLWDHIRTKPDSMIVIGTNVWKEECEYADYILPTAVDLEKDADDLNCQANRFLEVKEAEVEPLGEAKPDIWLWNEILKRVYGDETMFRQVADENHRSKLENMAKEGKSTQEILAYAKSHGLKEVYGNLEIIHHDTMKKIGLQHGYDFDNHYRTWPATIFDQGHHAVFQYQVSMSMLGYPMPENTEKYNPWSGVSIKVIKEKKGVFWPFPLAMLEVDPTFRGIMKNFQNMNPMDDSPSYWTPDYYYNNVGGKWVMEPWTQGKAKIDLKGAWKNSGVPKWTDVVEFTKDKSPKIDWAEPYPLLMITGKMGHMMQWSSRFNPMAGALQGPRVLINPATAKHLGIVDEGSVKVITARGSIVWKAKITETMPEKVIFIPAHTGPKSGVKSYAIESVNMLTNRVDSDPYTGFPAYSLAVCKVESAKEVA